MKRISIIFLSFILFNSCFNSKQELINYKYEKDLKNYTTNTFSQPFENFTDIKYFFIIPLNGCSPCVKELLCKLNSEPPNKSLIILTGKNKEKEITNLAIKIQEQGIALWDKEDEFIYYETNINSPTFLIKKGDHFYNQTNLKIGLWKDLSEQYHF